MNDDTIIHNETLPVNDSVTIQRGKHDKENPYVMISKKMLRDDSISPKSKGVLCYLLSLPDNWKAHPQHIADSLGVSKDQIYTVLKELIKTGYATRTESKGEKGQFGFVNYEFYEEKLEKPQIIKEKSTVKGFPDTVSPDTGNPPLKNTYSKENISKEPNSSLKVPDADEFAKANEMNLASPPKSKREKVEFSPKVREVGTQIVNILTKHEPEYIPPKNLAPMLQDLDFMLRLDKRDAEKVYDVLNWALADSFWRDKMFKSNPVKYLRDKYLQLKNKMEEKPKVNPNQVDRRLRDKDGSVVDAWKDGLF